MFQMLTCFNLKPSITLADFRDSLEIFTEHMRDMDLCEGCGPIGERVAESGLDTDAERGHGFFFLMDFRDRAQSDAALKYIKENGLRNVESHLAVFTKVRDPVFICWQTA